VSVGLVHGTDLPREGVGARFNEEVKARWRLLVAEENGHPPGPRALVHCECRLDQIFIAPAAQGRGMGRLLPERAKSDFPDGIVLVTHTDYARASAFCERRGFAPERTEDDGPHRRWTCHHARRPKP